MQEWQVFFVDDKQEKLFQKCVEAKSPTQPSSFPPKRYPKKPKQRDAIKKRLNNIGKPGTKRHQRYLNDKYLHDLKSDMDDEELEDAEDEWFYDNPEGPFFFEEFDGFIDITEEQQRLKILELSPAVNNKKKVEKRIGVLPKDLLNEMRECVDKNGYSHFIASLEQQLLQFFRSLDSSSKNGSEAPSPSPSFESSSQECISESSESDNTNVELFMQQGVYSSSEGSSLFSLEFEIVRHQHRSHPHLVFTFNNSFERRLCHGVASYYGVNSKSFDDKRDRKTEVTLPHKYDQVLPEESIIAYLRRIRSK